MKPKNPGENLEAKSPVERIRDILIPVDVEAVEQKLSQLEKRVETTESEDFQKHSLAKVFPEALEMEIRENGEEISKSFAPVIGKAITVQIKEEKDEIVDALYPVIGATVAKYMAESLKQLTDSINKKLDRNFSGQALTRKVRAQVTGVSEAELLFRESLGTDYQSLFLIHRKTGILVAETHSPQFQTQNGDMIAGMFTAISSFVESWISSNDDSGSLDAIEYGEHHILFEKSSSFFVAGVAKGPDPDSLRGPLQKLLQLIHLEFAQEFHDFDGDVSDIPSPIVERMEKILSISEAEEKATAKDIKKGSRLRLFLFLVFVGLCVYGFFQFKNYQLRQKIENVLSADPYLQGSPMKVTVSGDSVKFKGTVLNAAMKERLVLATEKKFPDLKNLDVQKVAVLQTAPLEQQDLVQRIQNLTGQAQQAGFQKFSIQIDSAGRAVLGGVANTDLVDKARQSLLSSQQTYVVVNETLAIDPFLQFAVEFPKGQGRPANFAPLKGLEALLKSLPPQHLIVWGGADNSGILSTNDKVSLSRAQALKGAFLGLKVPYLSIKVLNIAKDSVGHPLQEKRTAIILPAGAYEKGH